MLSDRPGLFFPKALRAKLEKQSPPFSEAQKAISLWSKPETSTRNPSAWPKLLTNETRFVFGDMNQTLLFLPSLFPES